MTRIIKLNAIDEIRIKHESEHEYKGAKMEGFFKICLNNDLLGWVNESQVNDIEEIAINAAIQEVNRVLNKNTRLLNDIKRKYYENF